MQSTSLTPNPSRTTTLLHLPIEVEINVLSELPARDIQRCRRVCRHFRDIIDEKSNANLLLRPGQTRSRSKISKELAHVTDLAGVDFLEAFSRWLSRRAIWVIPETRHVISTAFCEHWAKEAMPESVKDTPETTDVPEFPLQWLSDTLLALHITAHTSINTRKDFGIDYTFSCPANMHASLMEFLVIISQGEEEGLKRFGITTQKVRQYGEEVLAKPDRLAAPIVTPKSIPPNVMLSKRPLTTIKSWWACRPNSNRDYVFPELHLNSLGDDEWLSAFLQIPEIPKTCNHLFAYCAGTDWTYRQLEKAEEGQALTELEKTAILEDIILY
ncbi:hypothetical protein AC579_2245 [Pseudocercospora musae]|uniref:F-box domain-containing protein n=1 Tax=Pseudocercospora musae TaxID=113226 RepID=A0A139IUN6_9PEZI|nr:hypothetical protein AC579_2245 [Pseudocercospora musae]